MMTKKLEEFIDMFYDERNMVITMQFQEHFITIQKNESGYDILKDIFRNIPFELLRYSAGEEVLLSLKFNF